MTSQSVIGCLLGTAVGDALGLAYEGLPRQRAAKLLGPPDRFRLFGRWGLVSDDTEHACLVAQSVIASGCNPQQFERQLARRLRSWFLMLPAGIGLATLKACLKLCIGLSPSRSGVRSAGNGAAMRAASE
ncbi:MAG TPA: ADP-ribosylglycohydrolase family protein, partial [Planctomycetaceae bacterium]|nr:ADP-ribosylglycohydrolase family protein [Planctomycetaceae bacterium]